MQASARMAGQLALLMALVASADGTLADDASGSSPPSVAWTQALDAPRPDLLRLRHLQEPLPGDG